MKRRLLIGVLAAVLVVGLGGNYALAQVTFRVTNISNNAFNNYHPDINNLGQAVWSGNGQIYYFDTRWDPSTQSPINISNSAVSANAARINNQARQCLGDRFVGFRRWNKGRLQGWFVRNRRLQLYDCLVFRRLDPDPAQEP